VQNRGATTMKDQ